MSRIHSARLHGHTRERTPESPKDKKLLQSPGHEYEHEILITPADAVTKYIERGARWLPEEKKVDKDKGHTQDDNKGG